MSIFNKIRQYKIFKEKFSRLGITIINIRKSDIKDLECIYNTVKQAIDMFPILRGHFKWIAFVTIKRLKKEMNDDDYMAYSGFWHITHELILTKLGLGIGYPYSFMNDISETVDLKNLKLMDRNTYIEYLTWHEIGHIIDFIVTYDPNQFKYIETDDIFGHYYFQKESKYILENAKYNFPEKLTEEDFKNIFCKYVREYPEEIVAESLAIRMTMPEYPKFIDYVYDEFIKRLNEEEG